MEIMKDIYEGCRIVKFQTGERFFVDHMCFDDQTIAERQVKGRSNMFVFKIPTLVVVEGIHNSGKGCKHIRSYRAAREGAGEPFFVEVNSWPLMRKALKHGNMPVTGASGGFQFAVQYSDEMAIPDYSMSGSSGWVVKRSDIPKLKAALPPLKDSGELKTVWIKFAGFANTPDECQIQVCKYDPSDEPPLEIYDRARDIHRPCNPQVFKIDFDAGSRRVKRMKSIKSGEDISRVVWSVSPVQRDLEIGQRVPGFF